SVAVLCRRRSAFDVIAVALAGHGVPVELVEVGGLLHVPEVRDVVSTLQVLADAASGDALLRLLTGPRWRIGPRDLRALHQRARDLARRRGTSGPAGPDDRSTVDGADRDDAGAAAPPLPGSAEVQAADRATVKVAADHVNDQATAKVADDHANDQADPVYDASVIEALDDLGPPVAYSPLGYDRMRALRLELDGLRARLAVPLTDLVADVERTLGVDIEIGATGGSRVHLDRFLDVAAQFAQDAEVATIAAFLAYLDAAEDEERGLDPGEVVVSGDRVQVLTVHAAKGLEWDVVAVPLLTREIFPDLKATGDRGWIARVEQLPFALRGDASDLPAFTAVCARDQKDLDDRRKDFEAACKERGEREERRLAYVAVTRARHTLLASGHWISEGTKTLRGASLFLTDIRDAGGQVVHWAPAPPDPAPQGEPVAIPWPVNPLGARRHDVAAGAAMVRAAAAGTDPAPARQAVLFDPHSVDWEADVDLLLAERAIPHSATVDVPIPADLSVSALVALKRDPAALARRLRRPLPHRPAPLARRGTAFHAWLEQRFGLARLLDVDELPGASDDGALDNADLAELQAAFLAGPWANRRPTEVEVPFEARIGSLVVRGRIDAVFTDRLDGADGADGAQRYVVVDWKTGEEPTGEAGRAAAVQLAAYRLAWADLARVGVDRVRAAFHYVRTGHTAAPVDLLDAAGLADLVSRLPGPASAG
ncbi:MAG: 3'-5' exonuclease, partial [Mycobacteriales bacterium]